MTREDVLNKAKECVTGQREQDYGTPENNFQFIAHLWSDYIHAKYQKKEVFLLSSEDVANMMILLKVARAACGGGSGDNYVDIAGYAACASELSDLS